MPNNYGLFFRRDNTLVRLPVNPEKLPDSKKSENSSYNVLGIGPIVVSRTPELRTVEISSYFPGRVFSGVLTPNEFKPPEYYISFFRSAMNDRATITYIPVRFYENGEAYATTDTGFKAVVTQFNVEERGGETGDFYYTLQITEYRDYSPQTMQIVQTSADTPQSAADTPQAATVATPVPSRDVPAGQLYVGVNCIANGKYYSSSYGDPPYGVASGRSVVVSRIVDMSRAYPIHITTPTGGALGWITASGLQVVSDK